MKEKKLKKKGDEQVERKGIGNGSFKLFFNLFSFNFFNILILS